jgi:hypothetical protein
VAENERCHGDIPEYMCEFFCLIGGTYPLVTI